MKIRLVERGSVVECFGDFDDVIEVLRLVRMARATFASSLDGRKAAACWGALRGY